MCPTALGRKEKKLYNVHIVQCTDEETWSLLEYLLNTYLLEYLFIGRITDKVITLSVILPMLACQFHIC